MHSRRGSAAVPFAVMVTTLLAFGALAADRMLLNARDFEAQNAADAIAHAATVQLDGTDEGVEAARATAGRLASMSRVGNVYLTTNAASGGSGLATLELGRWEDSRFVPDTSDPRLVTAARVVVDRSSIPTLFGWPGLGVRSLAVQGTALALGGGAGSTECPAPIAIPSCSLPEGDEICDVDLVLNSDNNDNAGWARLGQSRPNASTVRDAINACGMGEVQAADVLSLNNGSINSAMNTMANAVSASTTTWNTAAWGTQPARSSNSGVNPYGRVLKTHFLVFEDPANCSGTKYNGTSLPVVGFVTANVYDVDTRGSVSQREIKARISCEVDPSATGGGGFFGTVAPPHLVSEG